MMVLAKFIFLLVGQQQEQVQRKVYLPVAGTESTWREQAAAKVSAWNKKILEQKRQFA